MKFLLLLVCGLLTAAHPRLFLTPETLKTVRAAIAEPGHHQQAIRMLRARLDRGVQAYTGRPGYQVSAFVRELAFDYQLTGDTSRCQQAFTQLQRARSLEDQPDSGYGLSRAMISVGYALAYDWCHAAWTPDQRREILTVMTSAADQWPSFRHANVDSPHKGSNWAGVTRGGELLLHLAANRDPGYGDRSDRIALCIRDLKQHIATAYGPSGWTQEGLGYLQYTFGFLAPAVYASRDPELQQRFRAITWHRLAMHAFPFLTQQMSLQSGVDSGATFREGFPSLIFPTVPPADLPYYLYWYDRHIGILAQQPRYDDHRAATIWAVLFYPNIPAAEPPAAWGGSLLDSQKGAFYFRNRWRDHNDILLSVMNRNDHHSHAWNQHETFQLSIMALDANFAAGPGKERDLHLYSKPILDGKRDASLGRGRTLRAEPGYVVLDGSENFGIAKAERRLRTRFSGDSAVITLWDRFQDATAHSLWWQLRPGQGVTAEPVTGEPLPSFLLRKGDAYLKGWIQTSAPVAITTDPVLRLDLGSSPSHDLLVVLVLGRGTPPRADSLAGGIRVLGRTHRRQDLPQ